MSYYPQNTYGAGISNPAYQPSGPPAPPPAQPFTPAYGQPYQGFAPVYGQPPPPYNQHNQSAAYVISLGQDNYDNQVAPSAPPPPPIETATNGNNSAQQEPDRTIIFVNQNRNSCFKNGCTSCVGLVRMIFGAIIVFIMAYLIFGMFIYLFAQRTNIH